MCVCYLNRWAKLDAPSDWPAADHQVHKMVMNVGRRPTVNAGDDVTVEVHILHKYSGDFYGKVGGLMLIMTISNSVRVSQNHNCNNGSNKEMGHT